MLCLVGGDNQIAYDTTHKPGRKIKQIAQTVLINENGYAPMQMEINIIECSRDGQYILFSVGKMIYSWDGCTMDKHYEAVRINLIGDAEEEDISYLVNYHDDFRGYIN